MTKAPDIQFPTIPSAPPPPILASAPQGQKPKRRSMQPTFLGSGSTPTPGTSPGKTLLGQ